MSDIGCHTCKYGHQSHLKAPCNSCTHADVDNFRPNYIPMVETIKPGDRPQESVQLDGHTRKLMIELGLTQTPALPAKASDRKGIPLASGVLDYFPLALVEVARASKAGNDQHNPGQGLHWAKGKSTDHADALLRHLVDRGTVDSDGIRHSAKVAWRALALLQTELENERAGRQGESSPGTSVKPSVPHAPERGVPQEEDACYQIPTGSVPRL